MADTKISAMTAATLPLTGTELVPIVQGGNNRKTTVADLDAYNRSYGSWSDSTDQIGSTVAGTVMTYNTADVTDGITLVGGSQITVPNTGIYDLQFSAQFQNTDNSQHEVWIWARVNNVDVPNSTTVITVPARKNNNIYGYAVAAWNLFFSLNSSDYIELVWLKSNALVTMEHAPASLSPAYPAIPSVIVSVQQVS
jgi:hypothetical protein